MILFLQDTNAAIDISSYSLNEKQIKILRNFEESGKYDEEWLHNFAKAMHNHNERQANRPREYIPPYTQEELYETILWARGGAFSSFADYAGYEFLGELYRADCPNVGLFRFGRATGTEYIEIDVMKEAINTSYYLQNLLAKEPEGFEQLFFELAVEYKMDKYLRKI